MAYSKDMKYNPEIWADMTSDERSTYYIAEAYNSFCKSRGDQRKHLPSVEVRQCPNYDRDGQHPADPIRNHKNWPYFVKVWERFEIDQAFDADIFMESVARHLPKDKQIFPAQLATKKNFDSYIEYRQSIKLGGEKIDDTKRIMQGIVQTYKLIARKVGSQKPTQQEIYYFFNKPKDNNLISEGLLLCMQQMISPYYFSVSRSFITAYKNSDKDIRDEILELSRLKDMALLTRTKTEVYNFVKKIFNEDIL